KTARIPGNFGAVALEGARPEPPRRGNPRAGRYLPGIYRSNGPGHHAIPDVANSPKGYLDRVGRRYRSDRKAGDSCSWHASRTSYPCTRSRKLSQKATIRGWLEPSWRSASVATVLPQKYPG